MKIVNESNPSFNLTEATVRLWKSDMGYTRCGNIADFLINRSIGGAETVFLENNPETPEIEENTGAEFPGLQFDCMLDKTWRDVDRTSNNFNFNYDLLVVEISPEGSPFIFRYNKNPMFYGKCESCYSIRILKVKCACNKV